MRPLLAETSLLGAQPSSRSQGGRDSSGPGVRHPQRGEARSPRTRRGRWRGTEGLRYTVPDPKDWWTEYLRVFPPLSLSHDFTSGFFGLYTHFLGIYIHLLECHWVLHPKHLQFIILDTGGANQAPRSARPRDWRTTPQIRAVQSV